MGREVLTIFTALSSIFESLRSLTPPVLNLNDDERSLSVLTTAAPTIGEHSRPLYGHNDATTRTSRCAVCSGPSAKLLHVCPQLSEDVLEGHRDVWGPAAEQRERESLKLDVRIGGATEDCSFPFDSTKRGAAVRSAGEVDTAFAHISKAKAQSKQRKCRCAHALSMTCL